MAANCKNYYEDFAVHHVTGTVHDWRPVLLSPEILSIFTFEFNRMFVRWNVELVGFVIMPEHFHMLVKSGRAENIPKFIRGGRRAVSGKVKWMIENNDISVNSFYSGCYIDLSAFYSKTAGKSEFRFWKEKPRVFPISKEDDLIKKLDYIHNNPVRRGLVKLPGDWEYSSFKFYSDGEKVKLPIYERYQDVIRL